jgi:hypothetical protein
MEMRLCVYNMVYEGRRGRKPDYIHEMWSHDLKSCEVKCQRKNNAIKDLIGTFYFKAKPCKKKRAF